MKKQLFAIAFGLTLMAAGLPAQSGTIIKDGIIITTDNGATQSFISQQADTLGTFVFVGGGGRGGQGVTGSPLSAREETRTVQTLGDGTQLETSEVTQFRSESLCVRWRWWPRRPRRHGKPALRSRRDQDGSNLGRRHAVGDVRGHAVLSRQI